MTSQSSQSRRQLAQFSALGVCIIASYAFARPVTDSLFLAHHTSAQLPWVFLLSAVATAVVLAIYNHFNTQYSLLRLLGFSAVISTVLMFGLLILHDRQMSGSIYALYVWREVYMVLLVEIFWSLADSVFTNKSARKSYGLILAIGSIGGALANLLVGYLSKSYGSKLAIMGVAPCLLACAGLTFFFSKSLGGAPVFLKKAKKTWGSESLTVVRSSKYLLPLLFLIAVVQISISLVDIQFSSVLESTYTNIDERTGIIGQLHAITDVIAVFLQFFSSWILKILGMGGVFVGIPIVLGACLTTFIIYPRFLVVAALKVASKCFDYSVFRASKEMLYIPLNHLEKTQGKALIDILVYRLAKSTAAILVIVLIALGINEYMMHIGLFLMIAWILLAGIIVKRYRLVIESVDGKGQSDSRDSR